MHNVRIALDGDGTLGWLGSRIGSLNDWKLDFRFVIVLVLGKRIDSSPCNGSLIPQMGKI